MDLFDILILAAIAAVAITLAFGLKALFTDGPEARSRISLLDQDRPKSPPRNRA